MKMTNRYSTQEIKTCFIKGSTENSRNKIPKKLDVDFLHGPNNEFGETKLRPMNLTLSDRNEQT